jgi:chromosome segregation ATPase
MVLLTFIQSTRSRALSPTASVENIDDKISRLTTMSNELQAQNVLLLEEQRRYLASNGKSDSKVLASLKKEISKLSETQSNSMRTLEENARRRYSELLEKVSSQHSSFVQQLVQSDNAAASRSSKQPVTPSRIPVRRQSPMKSPSQRLEAQAVGDAIQQELAAEEHYRESLGKAEASPAPQSPIDKADRHLLQAQYGKALQSLRQWMDKCNDLNQQLDAKQEDLLTLRREYDRELQESAKEMEKTRKLWKASLGDAERYKTLLEESDSELSTARSHFSDASVELDDWKERCQKMSLRCESLQQQLDAASVNTANTDSPASPAPVQDEKRVKDLEFLVTKFKEKLAAQVSDLKAVEQSRDASVLQCHELEQEVQTLKQQQTSNATDMEVISGLERKLAEVETTNEMLKIRVDVLTAELAREEADGTVKTTEIVRLQKELTSHEKQMLLNEKTSSKSSELQQELQQLQEEVATKDRRLQDLSNALSREESQSSSRLDEAGTLKTALAEKERRVQDLSNALSREESQSTARLDEIGTLKTALAEKERRVQDLSNALSREESQSSSRSDEIGSLKSRLAEKERRVQDLSNALSREESQSSSRLDEAGTLRTALAEKERRVQDLSNALSREESQSSARLDEIGTLKTALAEKERRVQDLSNALSREESMGEASNEKVALYEAKIAELERLLGSLSDRLGREEVEAQELQLQLKEAEQQRIAAEKLHALAMESQARQESIDQQKIKRLKLQIEAAVATSDGVLGDAASLMESNTALARERDDLRSQLQVANEDVMMEKKKVATQEMELAAVQKKWKWAEATLSESVQKMASLEETIATLKMREVSQDSDLTVQVATEAVSAINDDLHAEQAKNQYLTVECERMKSHIASLGNEKDSLLKRMEEIKAESEMLATHSSELQESLRSEVKSQRNAVEAHVDQRRVLEEQISDLTTKLTDSEEQYRTLLGEHDSLKSQLAQTKEELLQMRKDLQALREKEPLLLARIVELESDSQRKDQQIAATVKEGAEASVASEALAQELSHLQNLLMEEVENVKARTLESDVIPAEQWEESQAEIDRLNAQVTEKIALIDELEKALAEARQEVMKVTYQRLEAEKLGQETGERVDELEELVGQERLRADSAEVALQKLREAQAGLQESLQRAQRDATQAQQLYGELALAKKNAEQLQERIAHMTSEQKTLLSSAKESRSDWEYERKRLTLDNDRMAAEREEMKQAMAGLKEQLVAAESESEKASTRVEEDRAQWEETLRKRLSASKAEELEEMEKAYQALLQEREAEIDKARAETVEMTDSWTSKYEAAECHWQQRLQALETEKRELMASSDLSSSMVASMHEERELQVSLRESALETQAMTLSELEKKLEQKLEELQRWEAEIRAASGSQAEQRRPNYNAKNNTENVNENENDSGQDSEGVSTPVDSPLNASGSSIYATPAQEIPAASGSKGQGLLTSPRPILSAADLKLELSRRRLNFSPAKNSAALVHSPPMNGTDPQSRQSKLNVAVPHHQSNESSGSNGLNGILPRDNSSGSLSSPARSVLVSPVVQQYLQHGHAKSSWSAGSQTKGKGVTISSPTTNSKSSLYALRTSQGRR